MIQLPLSTRQLAGPSLLIIVMLILHLLPDVVTQSLVFDRSMVENGALWQLLTSTLLHTNTSHLLLNIGGVVLIWALHGQYYDVYKFLGVFVVCAVASTVGVTFLSSEIGFYYGASGALHGAIVWGAINDVRTGLKSGWLIVLVVAVKIVSEQVYGAEQAISNLIDAAVAIDAHLTGALAGIICALLIPKIKTPD